MTKSRSLASRPGGMNIVPARSQLSNQLSNVSSKKRYVCSYFSLIGFVGVPSFFTIEIIGCTR